MKLFEVFGVVNIDDKNADKKLDNIDSKAQKFGKNFGKVAKNVGKGALAIGGAFAAFSGIAIKNLEQQEIAEGRLESIAKRVTGATEEQIQSLKDLSAATQEYTTYGDDVVMAGQSQLLSFGMNVEQTGLLTESMANLLAATKGVNATQDDAVNAANMLGKAFSGQAGALSRAGIIMNDAQEEIIKTGDATQRAAAIAEIMEANYGGLAEGMAQTTEGMRKQISNAFGDITERIAMKFMPVVRNMLAWVQENLPKIEKFISNAFNIAGAAINGVVDVFNIYMLPVLSKFKSWLDTNMPAIKQTFKTIVEDYIIPIWNELYDVFNEFILPVLGTFYDWIALWIPVVADIIKVAFDIIVPIVKSLWTIITEFILPVLVKMFEWVSDKMPMIQDIFQTVFGIITEVLTAGFNIVNDFIGVITKLLEWVQSNLSIVGDIFSTVFDGIYKVVDGVLGVIEDVIEAFKTAIEWAGKWNDKEVSDTTVSGKTRQSGERPTGGKRAGGGPVKAGMAYTVGEVEEELFVPNQDGMIYNQEQLAGMGGVTVQNMTVRKQSDIKEIARELFLLQKQTARGFGN